MIFFSLFLIDNGYQDANILSRIMRKQCDFQAGPTQTGQNSFRKRLEA